MKRRRSHAIEFLQHSERALGSQVDAQGSDRLAPLDGHKGVSGLVEAVADVGGIEFVDADRFGIVGFDGYDIYPAVFVVGRQLGNAALIHLRRRQLIATTADHVTATSRHRVLRHWRK